MIRLFKVLIPLGVFFVAAIIGLYLWQMNESSTTSGLSGSNLVTFMTGDGVKIAGEFIRPTTDTAPVVLLVHQVGRDHTSWGSFPDFLHARGLGVLAIDLRGHGASTQQNGKTISYLTFTPDDWSNIDLDFHAALDWLKSRGYLLSRVSIVGASIGPTERSRRRLRKKMSVQSFFFLRGKITMGLSPTARRHSTAGVRL